MLHERDGDIVGLMKDSDVLFRALVARREAVHNLLVSTSRLSTELTTLVKQSRADLKPALEHLDNVVAVLNKNEDNLDNSLRLMAPFTGSSRAPSAVARGSTPTSRTCRRCPTSATGWRGMSAVKRGIVPAIIVALLAAAAFVMFRPDDTKTLTAHFPRTISIYEGSDVRVLGVPVGKVDSVTPDGTDVVVTMSHDADTKIPADAKAAIIAPRSSATGSCS